MFTGIIETMGRLERREPRGAGARLTITTRRPLARLAIGESVAVNGACLTVTTRRGARFTVDVSPETLRRTTLGRLAPGAEVNLEPALRAGEPLGGHYVQGHVDGVCRVRSVERDGAGLRVSIEAPSSLLRYVVEKGSVAVHGVALTVTEVDDEAFGVALIPYTLSETTFGTIAVGDELNLEVDVLAKYVERLIAGRRIRSST